MREHTNRVAKSRAYVRTETGYKAVSLDDLPEQREVQAAEYGKAVNPEAGWEESYHAFFGEVSSTKAEVKNIMQVSSSNNER